MTESKTRAQCVSSARWDLYGGGPEPEAKGRPYRGNNTLSAWEDLSQSDLQRMSSSGRLPTERPRFLSVADCQNIAHRLPRVARGGGDTTVTIVSAWIGNVRWARNLISTSGEVRNDYVKIDRNVNGARTDWVLINDTSDEALVAVTRRAERLVSLQPERPMRDLLARWHNEPPALPTTSWRHRKDCWCEYCRHSTES